MLTIKLVQMSPDHFALMMDLGLPRVGGTKAQPGLFRKDIHLNGLPPGERLYKIAAAFSSMRADYFAFDTKRRAEETQNTERDRKQARLYRAAVSLMHAQAL